MLIAIGLGYHVLVALAGDCEIAKAAEIGKTHLTGFDGYSFGQRKARYHGDLLFGHCIIPLQFGAGALGNGAAARWVAAMFCELCATVIAPSQAIADQLRASGVRSVIMSG